MLSSLFEEFVLRDLDFFYYSNLTSSAVMDGQKASDLPKLFWKFSMDRLIVF